VELLRNIEIDRPADFGKIRWAFIGVEACGSVFKRLSDEIYSNSFRMAK